MKKAFVLVLALVLTMGLAVPVVGTQFTFSLEKAKEAH